MSIKCTPKTINILNDILNQHPVFEVMREYGVITNASWFFKFSSLVFLRNLKKGTEIFTGINDLPDFAYSCHYVNYYEEKLSKYLTKVEI